VEQNIARPFHKGLQFCMLSASHTALIETGRYAHQRVMLIVAWLRHQDRFPLRFHKVMRSDISHNLCTRVDLCVKLLLQLPQRLFEGTVSINSTSLGVYLTFSSRFWSMIAIFRKNFFRPAALTFWAFAGRLLLCQSFWFPGWELPLLKDRDKTGPTTSCHPAMCFPCRRLEDTVDDKCFRFLGKTPSPSTGQAYQVYCTKRKRCTAVNVLAAIGPWGISNGLISSPRSLLRSHQTITLSY
jgi:hypothetical protein